MSLTNEVSASSLAASTREYRAVAQNLANVEKDLRACAESSIGESKEAISSKLEMVVRAYDPCISCSVHLLEVNFK